MHLHERSLLLLLLGGLVTQEPHRNLYVANFDDSLGEEQIEVGLELKIRIHGISFDS